jgi:GNAT superfamily N-acetyltransferase
MSETFERGEYSISTDPDRLDLDAIHAYLARAYGCEGIPCQTLERAITNSLCLRRFHGKDQVGLARVITDSANYAYLCDVYVLEADRGKGLAKRLMECGMAHPALQGLRRFTLAPALPTPSTANSVFANSASPNRRWKSRAPTYIALAALSQVWNCVAGTVWN